MQSRFFKLTLLSDIVLQKYANTQGKNESLDSISGAVILGIVAEKYDEFGNPFSIFHSGDVRFGEAKPFIDNQIGYKIPLNFFRPKDSNDKDSSDFKKVYNMSFCDFSELLSYAPKAIASGFITNDLFIANPAINYAQKVNLQTKDNDIFGYCTLNKGGVYGFCVDFSDKISKDEVEKIANILQGIHYIGKSKSAEFGKIEITQIPHIKAVDEVESSEDFDILYLDSHLAMFKNAMPTYDLSALDLEILYDKSFIKTSAFCPYNTKRGAKDSARLIIEKGSVIGVKKLSIKQKHYIKSGVGGFLSEGFGKILINPSFVMQREFSLKSFKCDSIVLDNAQISADSNLIAFLESHKDRAYSQINLADKIDAFIAENKNALSGITKAQWGTIRAFTHFIRQEDLPRIIEQFIDYEARAEMWQSVKIKLLNFIKDNATKEAIALLAMRCQQEGSK